jgi:hypothetical protein
VAGGGEGYQRECYWKREDLSGRNGSVYDYGLLWHMTGPRRVDCEMQLVKESHCTASRDTSWAGMKLKACVERV